MDPLTHRRIHGWTGCGGCWSAYLASQQRNFVDTPGSSDADLGRAGNLVIWCRTPLRRRRERPSKIRLTQLLPFPLSGDADILFLLELAGPATTTGVRGTEEHLAPGPPPPKNRTATTLHPPGGRATFPAVARQDGKLLTGDTSPRDESQRSHGPRKVLHRLPQQLAPVSVSCQRIAKSMLRTPSVQ